MLILEAIRAAIGPAMAEEGTRMATIKPGYARIGFMAVAVATTLSVVASTADARPGRGFSFGSRGDRTFSAPPPTNTAPKAAAPIGKSMTQPGATAAPAAGVQPGAGAATPASRFGGFRGLLMGGLFAAAFAGIFGMGALASVLGFLLQALLIGGLVWLALSWFRNRQMGGAQPAMAGAGGARQRRPNAEDAMHQRRAAGGSGGGSRPGLELGKADFDTFEARLGDVQTAYGRNNVKALETLMTPEMLSYLAEELAENARKGITNEVSGAKLLQGDLAESWREASGEYATVAMRYSLLDAEVETASGRVISGSRTEPTEVTEVWTFRRPKGGAAKDWELSAIQQA